MHNFFTNNEHHKERRDTVAENEGMNVFLFFFLFFVSFRVFFFFKEEQRGLTLNFSQRNRLQLLINPFVVVIGRRKTSFNFPVGEFRRRTLW